MKNKRTQDIQEEVADRLLPIKTTIFHGDLKNPKTIQDSQERRKTLVMASKREK